VDAAHEASIIVACNATTGDLDRLRNFYSVPIIVMVPVKATSELARLDLYEHGADTIIESGQTELFIAHIRALLRRRDWRTDHRTTENPLRSVDPQETGG
jgi:DNA-binding response OmpR family regulator